MLILAKFFSKLFQPLRRCLSLLEYESYYKLEDIIFLTLDGIIGRNILSLTQRIYHSNNDV